MIQKRCTNVRTYDIRHLPNDHPLRGVRHPPIHTWVSTEEEVMEPPEVLKEALRKRAMEETGVFDVCDIGESREFD